MVTETFLRQLTHQLLPKDKTATFGLDTAFKG
jgi:hypothetical protein